VEPVQGFTRAAVPLERIVVGDDSKFGPLGESELSGSGPPMLPAETPMYPELEMPIPCVIAVPRIATGVVGKRATDIGGARIAGPGIARRRLQD
jgi:hypothetical protein